MAIQKLHKADNTKKLSVDGQKIPVALVGDTCWYALKDVIKLLGIKKQTCVVAAHLSEDNKRLFSFGSRPTFVVDLKGIHEMTTMFDINDWALLSELVKEVATVFNTRQEFVSMELDKAMNVPKVTQEDMLALEVLNANSDEDRVLALASYKMFITQ
ncbi:Bro-N domain-containing protein [Bacillus cereus group sp. BfR-BA-01358]|uniref:Bro-N domain-containing protein n=1 Tax=Bacillus cereus group sp. BfR-BA-01358 TaxID=2920320 RepID=UPI001F573B71|nr:Bro-N domain-containing protein [Bacillus cereus group sp. BfR-BA-01358]